MDVYARLQAAMPHLAERMVFITGGAFAQDVRDFLAGVKNAHLEKPFDMGSMSRLVHEVLAGAVAHRG